MFKRNVILASQVEFDSAPNARGMAMRLDRIWMGVLLSFSVP